MAEQPSNTWKDPRLPEKPLRTYTGRYESIRLDCSPQFAPEDLDLTEPSLMVEYTVGLGWLHLYLDGADATELVPSAYLYSLLGHLLFNLESIVTGGTISADWGSDPWRMDVQGSPETNSAIITLHSPRNNWVAMRNVNVPLDMFCREVVSVAKKWLEYLDSVYHHETRDPEKGQSYRKNLVALQKAEKVLQDYELQL